MLGTLVGTLVIVAVVTYFSHAQGRALTGRRLVVLLVAAPVALFAWKVGYSHLFDGGDRWWPSKPGLKCMLLSTVDGTAILAGLIAARRGAEHQHPVATGAGMGIAAGALAWVLVDLWCPVGHPAHVFLGHVVPMFLLAAIGAWPGGAFIARRSPPALRVARGRDVHVDDGEGALHAAPGLGRDAAGRGLLDRWPPRGGRGHRGRAALHRPGGGVPAWLVRWFQTEGLAHDMSYLHEYLTRPNP